jgi:hypothetical protein
MNLCVRGAEDVRPLERDTLDEEWSALATQLSESLPVVYDTFYVYESEEE